MVRHIPGLDGAVFAVQSLRRASRFEAEALRLQVLAKDAELRALQAQVNPHFFFNSLNSVRALVFEDREAAAAWSTSWPR